MPGCEPTRGSGEGYPPGVILPLTTPVRDYAWGSRTLLPELTGTPATGRPQAELWIGAHPGDPCTVAAGSAADQPLDRVIAADPVGMLGPDVADRFGGHLPFLLKVLAVARPLSIQAHPSSEQAAAGYAAEEAAGVDIGAPERCFRDRHHKPEMLVALTRFEGLVGWADPARAVELVDAVDVPPLTALAAGLRHGQLSNVVAALFSMPTAAMADLARQVAAGAAEALRPGGEPAVGDTVLGPAERRILELVVVLARQYPTDLGVPLTLLLNHVVLQPGEAVFVPPGVPHAYLSGLGIEAQASSDNTLRAGLTTKHVDTARLLETLNFSPSTGLRVAPEPLESGHQSYVAPVRDFCLSRIEPAGRPVSLAAGQPWAVFGTAGDLQIRSVHSGSIDLGRGQAVFVPASAQHVSVQGEGVAYAITVNSRVDG